MRTLFVGYDLNRPGQNDPALIEAPKRYHNWWHYLDATWVIQTTADVTAVRDRLGALIDSSDELLVMDITGTSWASRGLPQPATDWLHSYL